MRLADFIELEMEAILANWEGFAATQLPAATHMEPLALRDHAQQILIAVAADLRTLQSKQAQTLKSRGQAPHVLDAPDTAAQTHGMLRARSGFDINQLVAEYRALRASVLALWMDERRVLEGTDLEDVIRFNEAIDQALIESVAFFSSQVEQAQNLLLGMLGHDMRSPLQTIQITATFLAASNAGLDVSRAASRLINSGARMKTLLDDLLDFSRTKLGLGINVSPRETDLARLFHMELDQLRAAHPDRQLELSIIGKVRGVWDGARLQRLLSNLVLNALKYGATDTPVRVDVIGDNNEVRFEVRNRGAPIDSSVLDQIFNPLRRGPDRDSADGPDQSLGLGLYIAREIAKAHGGDVAARSDATETVFTVRLPRRL